MKHLFQIALVAALPALAFSLSSCDDDKDLPDVDITLSVENATVVDGTIYAVQGETIDVTSLNVVNNEANKGAAVTNVRYYWDGLFYSPSFTAPFAMSFPTSEATAIGKHSINVVCTVLAVDKSVATATISYPVEIVASADDIPGAADTPEITNTVHLDN